MFNLKGSWDKSFLADGACGFGDPICTLCVIHKGNVLPKSFIWKKQTFKIEKILFSWRDRRGKENIRLFSVKTSKGTYQLLFEEAKFSWHLNKLLGP